MWLKQLPLVIGASVVCLVLSACNDRGNEREDVSASLAAQDKADYNCEGMEVAVAFIGEDAANVFVGGKLFTLEEERTASGVKYSDGKGNSFWTEGEVEALLTLSGQGDRKCTAVL
ncbi:MliC family protein [Pseudomonas sp. MH2]|uniref:MliC family protein n=1 Tax=Pseudomonas machongensis TaxID=3110229 RepID=A0ABU5VK03_9PSED|nr:MliC family protein [Pseudomonas sp. MH2]MEA5673708.1 MliC family protein [Pseudomonas sp. MH2]